MAQDGLADRTRLHLHRVTHTMLKHAAQWGAVARNVASMVDAPRVQGARSRDPHTRLNSRPCCETLRGRALYPIVATALGTGLRRGELLALRWQDVDLDGAHLRVERTLGADQAGRAPVQGAQDQVRPAHGDTAALHRHAAARAPEGAARAPHGARARQGAGRRAGVSQLGRLDPLAQRRHQGMGLGHAQAGLKATLHSLRHTHASTLIASGLDVLTISRRLGHGSPAITLGIYGHLFKTDDRAAAIMERALTGAE